MYRLTLFIIAIFFSFSIVFAVDDNITHQNSATYDADLNQHFTEEAGAEIPDEAGAPMPNVGILEEKQVIDVVEGVGHIPFNKVAFRAGPSLKYKVLKYSSGAEKVILQGETGDWYKVLMNNNAIAYVQKKYVRTTKLFMDETVARNKMNKTLSIELEDLLYKFNSTIARSSYTKKYEIRPLFDLVEAKNEKNNVTLVFNYTCANSTGKPIPSLKTNDLYKNMQDFIDIILGRLVLTNAEKFTIIIKEPIFNETGDVESFGKEYAVITLDAANIDIDNIRKNNISILSLVSSTIPVKELFKTFPR